MAFNLVLLCCLHSDVRGTVAMVRPINKEIITIAKIIGFIVVTAPVSVILLCQVSVRDAQLQCQFVSVSVTGGTPHCFPSTVHLLLCVCLCK